VPLRKTPLKTGYFYHIFSRGVNRAPIFTSYRNYKQFIETVRYYKYKDVAVAFSHFRDLSQKKQQHLFSKLNLNKRLVSLISYTLMSNHFHFVLRQDTSEGIKIFMRKLLTSYGKYFNMQHQRVGPLFQGRFKAVLIETQEQLLHVVRYCHLNPYASLTLSTIQELLEYPWSSLREYLQYQPNFGFCDNKEIILSCFADLEDFKKFTLDYVDFQEKVKTIGHLVSE
jgi:putative transposase